MPRYRLPPLTLANLHADGPPVRLRDLVAITGLSKMTILRDIDTGDLHAFRRKRHITSPYLIDRDVARHWLSRHGYVAEPRRSAVIVSIAAGESLSLRKRHN